MVRLISEARRISWPGDRAFAFTIFDDPDFQTVERVSVIYDFLTDHGFRITKGVWPGDPSGDPANHWGTCADSEYLSWIQRLQARGFEIGWHGAFPSTASRDQTIAGLERFRSCFGQWPQTATQHYDCKENVYWGDLRVSGVNRLAYNLLTRCKNLNHFRGHVPGHPYYWSDICRQRIKYVRNFVFAGTNTLAECPLMPYHDPDRPGVQYWFASSEGAYLRSFNERISEQNQDRLEEQGGACIMYTHFAYDFAQRGKLDTRFLQLMERLSKKNGWFVPVSVLLDYLLERNGPVIIDAASRRSLERRWLAHKLRFGAA